MAYPIMKIEDDQGNGYIAIELPVVAGSVDFRNYKLLLEKIDQLLKQSGIEENLGTILVEREMSADPDNEADGVDAKLPENIWSEMIKFEEVEPEDKRGKKKIKSEQHYRKYASCALRCTIARFLTQESYRAFSIHLADSILLRKFCGYSSPHSPKSTPSKSTLQRFESFFDTDTLKAVGDLLIVAASDENSELFNNLNGLFMGIDTDYLFLDSTCAKLDIHFPVDWVLLKDCVKSIIQSIIQIRSYGIKNRMDDPMSFLSAVNKVSMEMTNASSGRGAKKQRKATFRKLKTMLLIVERHGQRYLKKVQENWDSTDLTEAQFMQIKRKLSHTLELVPRVIHQASERIIGERQVNNEDKILSIHEEHAKVYNRGKSGAQVEFGLQLLLGENLDGVITHWELYDHSPKPDYQYTDDILTRVNKMPKNCQPSQLIGDRGFYSKRSEKKIENAELISNMCPKDPKVLKERLSEESFKELLTRRAQTEARIGILQNNFMGKKLRVHGYEAQRRHVAWAVLAHNLWVVARFPYKDLLKEDAA